MFVDYRGSVTGLLTWQWRNVVLFAAMATLVVTLVQVGGWKAI